MTIFDLFDYTIEKNASDLHLVVGYQPTVRVNKELNSVKQFPVLDETLIKDLIFSILSADQKENLFLNKEIDFGYEYKGYRFRANVYFSRGKMAAAFRLINKIIGSLEEYHLPQELKKVIEFNQGLVLVTGPTGEGKSTTIASLVNLINLNYFKHIITIEDPIEYIYPKGKSLVSQREIHQDTLSWRAALRSVLREDPDVVVVGEMRDYETIESVLTIAETGHLVFSSLHTGSTPEAINRIIDVFPSHQQQQARTQLSSVLKLIIAQRLIPNIDFSKRIPAVEILYNNMAISSVIREGKTHLIDNI
ncbi:MAG: type IV pilus twitching motility protein PilT, partial [Bacteroidales bacterium]